MTMHKIFETPEVYLISVPFRNVVTTETNIYVIRDSGDTLLVDLGAPTLEAAECVKRALDELGVKMEDARYFFTHLHYDHSGLVSEILPDDAVIYINRAEMRAANPAFTNTMNNLVKNRLEEEGMELYHAAEICASIELATPLDDGSRSNIVVVEEGDSIEVGRFSFDVVDLPGHTRGMMGLYQKDSGLFFSGDQLLFIITPTTGLFLDSSDSIAAYENSMRKVLDLNPTMLLHSHGEIRPDFRERGASIIRSKRKRLDLTVDVVSELIRETDGDLLPRGMDIIRRMGWKIPFTSIDECEQRQQWLIYTQGISILDHLVFEGRLQRIQEPAISGNALFLNRYAPDLVI